MDKRPDLSTSISLKDFKEFYWLKAELIQFCRSQGLSTSGGKLELANRIEYFLKTGEKQSPKKKKKSTSTFDWNSEPLALDTIITDNYKNTEHVRSFFIKHLGEQFKFNVRFMNWMKSNVGKTLKEAVLQYEQIRSNKTSQPERKDIAPQFEYNTYLRDFLADNPNSTREKGIQLWNIKRRLRGDNVYSKEDFKLLE